MEKKANKKKMLRVEADIGQCNIMWAGDTGSVTNNLAFLLYGTILMSMQLF